MQSLPAKCGLFLDITRVSLQKRPFYAIGVGVGGRVGCLTHDYESHHTPPEIFLPYYKCTLLDVVIFARHVSTA